MSHAQSITGNTCCRVPATGQPWTTFPLGGPDLWGSVSTPIFSFWHPKKAAGTWEVLHMKTMSASSGGEGGSRVMVKTHRWHVQAALLGDHPLFFHFAFRGPNHTDPGNMSRQRAELGGGRGAVRRESRSRHDLTQPTPGCSQLSPCPPFRSPITSSLAPPSEERPSFFCLAWTSLRPFPAIPSAWLSLDVRKTAGGGSKRINTSPLHMPYGPSFRAWRVAWTRCSLPEKN